MLNMAKIKHTLNLRIEIYRFKRSWILQHYNSLRKFKCAILPNTFQKLLSEGCHVKLGWWLFQRLTFGDSQTHHRVLVYFSGNRHTCMTSKMAFQFVCVCGMNSSLCIMMVSPTGRITTLNLQINCWIMLMRARIKVWWTRRRWLIILSYDNRK